MENKFISEIIHNANEIKEYNKNEVVFNENDACDSMGIVLEGKLLIASYTYNGTEILFNNINKNGLFGHSLIFSSSPFYKGKIISESKSKVAFINKDRLAKVLKDPTMLNDYLSIINDELLKTKEKTRILAFDSTTDRLLYYLTIHDKIVIESISSLAKSLSVTRESLSRTLKKLSEAKVISFEGKCITLLK